MALIVTDLSSRPLDIAHAVETVTTPDCGGIGLFIGTVRADASATLDPVRTNHAGTAARDGAKLVTALEYDAHPFLAADALASIAQEASSQWDVRRIVAVHRTGECALGEPTVLVACSAPHRSDALNACRWIIDEIKSRVPIWKREIYDDGSSRWVGAGSPNKRRVKGAV